MSFTEDELEAEKKRREMFLGEESDFLSNLETNLNSATAAVDLEEDFLKDMSSALKGTLHKIMLLSCYS